MMEKNVFNSFLPYLSTEKIAISQKKILKALVFNTIAFGMVHLMPAGSMCALTVRTISSQRGALHGMRYPQIQIALLAKMMAHLHATMKIVEDMEWKTEPALWLSRATVKRKAMTLAVK